MKSIDGRASVVVDTGVEECFALLSAVDRYPIWNGELVRRVDVVERSVDGLPIVARMMLHVAQSPFGKEFEFLATIAAEPIRTVRLARLADRPSDRDGLELIWSLSPNGGTRIELAFHAATSLLPGFFPLFGVGDEIAQFLVGTVAHGLSRPHREDR